MQNRRDLLKLAAGTAVGLTLGTGLRSASAQTATASYPGSDTIWAEQLGWRLGCHIYSFNRFTFEEGVKKNVQTGCRVCEVFPGQKIAASTNGTIGPGMSKDDKKLFKTILADNGCVCLTIGVTDASERTFDFCSEMGIQVINSEPQFKDLPAIDKLCEKYDVKVGLHNHPTPSIYWDFKTVLENIKDLSPRIGACADTGHYMRSGIKPLDAIKALKGRIVSFHFKDLNKFGGGAHDVAWGKGEADVAGILRELADQRFHGCFSAEFEHNWDNSVPEIAEGVKFFNETAKSIVLG